VVFKSFLNVSKGDKKVREDVAQRRMEPKAHNATRGKCRELGETTNMHP
jgi:hypothetical protein